MAVFDVTSRILLRGKHDKSALVDWLVENVGCFIGGPYRDGIIAVGHGWEFRTEHTMDMYTDDIIINWVIDITDEQKSTLFALKWS